VLTPIDVIIPTICDQQRGPLLMRAIAHVLSQEGVAARPIVVVNGGRVDPGTFAALEARRDVHLIRIEKGNLFLARRTGFEAVRSEFFAIHDDDDILLPGALARRLKAFRDDPGVDWVASDGIFVWPDREVPYIPSVEAVRRDPFGTLLDHCWLCSAGNLFRTAAIPAGVFDGVPSMDITYIALRLLAEGKKLALIDEPTFKYFYYPNSLSKQDYYNLAAPEAIRTMMALPVPAWVRRGLAGKYRRAMHDVAGHAWMRGALREAWLAHLRSIAGFPEFFRFLSFTRKLLLPAGRPAAPQTN
jgi:glycosyltransferase involved in cell wall biosynthesis